VKELLEGKTIGVFGAAGLIGRALVRGALNQGAAVVAVDQNPNNIVTEAISPSLEKGMVSLVGLDATDEVAVEAFFHGQRKLDGLINAIYPRGAGYGAHLFDVSSQQFLDNVGLQIGSSFIVTKACAEHFKRWSRPFSLVNLASVYGSVTPRFDIYEGTSMTMPVEYAVVKAGLLQLSRYVTRYVNDSDFRVNCVSPGGVLDGQHESFIANYTKYTNGAGLVGAEDVVGICLFLLSDLAGRVTGQDVKIDDGFSL